MPTLLQSVRIEFYLRFFLLLHIIFFTVFDANAQCSCVWIAPSGLITCYVGNCSSGAFSDCQSASLETGGSLCTSATDCPFPTGAVPGCNRGCTVVGACWFNGNGCKNENTCDTYGASPLPISLVKFGGENQGAENVIEWVTDSEQNNLYFTLSYSVDGVVYNDLITFMGAGNSTERLSYRTMHVDFPREINYYRLIQTDFDGQTASYGPISIDNRTVKRNLLHTYNTMGQEVTEGYTGIVIYYYDDGTTEKIYR